MEKNSISQKDVVLAVAKSMSEANSLLVESAPDRFNRYLLNLIQQEIRTGKEMALRERRFNSNSQEYVYRNKFPLALYEGMSPDFLRSLEVLDVYIWCEDERNAKIKIIFRF